MKAKKARIQDVAEKAGVSTMTVSRVLSKDTIVSETKTALVLDAIKTLNYRPNIAAQRLAGGKSFLIGLLYFDLDTSFVSKFLLSSLKSCRNTDHHLIPEEIDENMQRSISAVKELIDVNQVDGVILLPPICDIKAVLNTLKDANVPFVRISPNSQSDLSPYICMDDYRAGYNLTEFLVQKGHTKIAHIRGNPNQDVSRLRYQGYLDALKANQIEVPIEYFQQGFFTYDSGVDAAKSLLKLDDRPTAIFAANDEMAAGVISAANIAGLSVPAQISVVGFDDGHLAITVSPHLTTIRQPIQEMASLALEMLAAKNVSSDVTDVNTELRHLLPFEIIERDSVAAI